MKIYYAFLGVNASVECEIRRARRVKMKVVIGICLPEYAEKPECFDMTHVKDGKALFVDQETTFGHFIDSCGHNAPGTCATNRLYIAFKACLSVVDIIELTVPSTSYDNPPSTSPRTPIPNNHPLSHVYPWTSFDSKVATKDVLADHRDRIVTTPYLCQMSVSDEVQSLQSLIKVNFLDRYAQLGIHNVKFAAGRLYRTETTPDYVLVHKNQPIACIEVKGYWTFS